MKTKLAMILILTLSLLSVSGCAKKTPEEIKKEEDKKAAEVFANVNWEKPTFMINGKELTLPFKAKELQDLGFRLSASVSDSDFIKANEEAMYYAVVNNKSQFNLQIANDLNKGVPLGEAYVTEINYDFTYDKPDLLISGGLSLDSTQEEVLKVMGKPTSKHKIEYDDGDVTKFTFMYGEFQDNLKYGDIVISFKNGKIRTFGNRLSVYPEDLKNSNNLEKVSTEVNAKATTSNKED